MATRQNITEKQFTIDVGYKVNGVGDINMTMSTFEVDVKVFLFWTDEKAIGKKAGISLNLTKEGLFDPEIFVTNDHRLNLVSNETRVTDSQVGSIKCTLHYRGTAFIRAMDLQLFPFDCQNLQLCLKSKIWGVDRLLLKSRSSESALEHHVVHEWDILDHKMNEFYTTSPNGKEFSTLFVTILAQRQSGWFVNNVFIVSGGLLIFAWLTYLAAPEDRPDKVDIIVCAMIASVANKFVVGDELPKVPYRTLVDCYVDMCFLLIMIAMGAVFLVHFILEEEHDELFAWEVNWIIFGCSGGMWLLFHLWLILQIRSVHNDIKLWAQFDNEDSKMVRAAKRYLLRESHFLDVAGVKVHSQNHNSVALSKRSFSASKVVESHQEVQDTVSPMPHTGASNTQGNDLQKGAYFSVTQSDSKQVQFTALDADGVSGPGGGNAVSAYSTSSQTIEHPPLILGDA